MPTYSMKNKETGEVEEMYLTLQEREDILSTGEYEQMLSTASFISQHGSTISKTSGDWKDLLKKIKKGSGSGSSINS